jgi:hypothetical protein
VTRYLLFLAAFLLLLPLTGCAGNKATGKYSNQDKPKPVEASK